LDRIREVTGDAVTGDMTSALQAVWGSDEAFGQHDSLQTLPAGRDVTDEDL
jgi:hypothetical protein